MSEDLTPAPDATEPEKPRGRCGTCTQIVLLEDTFEREVKGQNVRVHRRGVTRHNIVGTDICGPVVDKFVFHVYAIHQEPGQPERTFRTFLASLESPEERVSVLEEWEAYLERERSQKDAEGNPVAGAPRVTVVVTGAKLIGSK